MFQMWLNLKMPVLNGIELGKVLRKQFPQMIIVYISSYQEFY